MTQGSHGVLPHHSSPEFPLLDQTQAEALKRLPEVHPLLQFLEAIAQLDFLEKQTEKRLGLELRG